MLTGNVVGKHQHDFSPQTVCLSEETKDEIDLRQMDEMAVLQMQELMVDESSLSQEVNDNTMYND